MSQNTNGARQPGSGNQCIGWLFLALGIIVIVDVFWVALGYDTPKRVVFATVCSCVLRVG